MKTLYFLLGMAFSAPLFSQVSLSGALSGDFSDLALAFGAIESGGGTGTVVVSITADLSQTETALLGSNGYRVIIRPVGNRIVSISSAAPVIRLNNVQNVWIDGISLNGDTTLTFQCTASNSTAAVLLLDNDAAHNRISNCTVLGGTLSGTTFFGVITLRNSSGSMGCDLDTISGNIIREFSDSMLPQIGISMWGASTANMNNNCLIEDNQIVNVYHAAAISDGIFSWRFNRGTTIRGNHFYQTSARATNNSSLTPNMRAIEIADAGSASASGAFVVRDNWIGGTAPFCGGTPQVVTNATGPVVYFGIMLNVGTSLNRIDGNHIGNLDLSFRDPTTPNWYFFMGIFVSAGNVSIGEMAGNVIGSDTSEANIILRCRKSNNGSVQSCGINDQGSASITVANNRIGGVRTIIQNSNDIGLVAFQAINVYNGGGSVTDNHIGSASIPASIDVNNVTQDVQIDGIACEGGAYTVERNRIQGLRNQTGFALVGVRFHFGTASTSIGSLTCKHNYIAQFQVPTGYDIDMAGISINASAVNAQTEVSIEYDTIRQLSIGAAVTSPAFLFGISVSFTVTGITFCGGSIRNNLIEELDNQKSGPNTGCAGIEHLIGHTSPLYISDNTIRNLTARTAGLSGIIVSPETAAMVTASAQRVNITGNSIHGLLNTYSEEVNVFGIIEAGRFPIVSHNRIYDLQMPNTTNALSLAAAISAFDITGSQTHTIHNNMIALDHGNSGSGQTVGIYAALYNGTTSINKTNISFNTVYIGGTNVGPSTAFLRDGADQVSIKNNIFYNDADGTGPHTAIANIAAVPAQNWDANASDHNYLVSRYPDFLNTWGTELQSMTQWQSGASCDLQSYTRVAGTSTFADQLFIDPDFANLDLQLDHLDEVLVLQNAGVPITGITTDFFGNTRDASTPDLGAREFETIVGTHSVSAEPFQLHIMPNPTSDVVLISLDAEAGAGAFVQLSDMSGKILQKQAITSKSHHLSLKNYPASIYQVVVTTGRGAVARRLVKE